jgi:hypothetical protein
MVEPIMRMVSILTSGSERGRELIAEGSTEHWGPNDPLAQDQQDIRQVAMPFTVGIES